MTSGLMRRFFSTSARTQFQATKTARSLTARRILGLRQYKRTLSDAGTRQASVSRYWFTSSSPCLYPEPDECEKERMKGRDLKLGNTIRVLHDRLPTLLIFPLPQDILSPHISLHLFPSTHPHLPTVSGRFSYAAALWTAPVAWGQIPVLGNVKLKILSERMVKNGGSAASNVRNEKLIVRWQTCGKSDKKENGKVSDVVEKIASRVAGSKGPQHEFSGLFKFEFDEEGRILNHIIEHTEEGQHWDRTAKVISVTDWLLGRAWGMRDDGSPSLAFAKCNREKSSRGQNERR